jgi:hypothetical protein
MSKNDAAEALNLHKRHAVPLLARWPSSFGDERTVPSVAVDRLSKRFMSPTELALLVGTSPAHASLVATRAGLRRLSPAGYDRGTCLRMFTAPPTSKRRSAVVRESLQAT